MPTWVLAIIAMFTELLRRGNIGGIKEVIEDTSDIDEAVKKSHEEGDSYEVEKILSPDREHPTR